MPMNFPDLASLRDAAEVHRFRPIGDGESEAAYRTALADHVASKDFIESEEIRNGVGWDKWTEEQKKEMLRRKGFRI